MEKETLMDKIRDIIGGIAFRLLLWSLQKTADEYWTEIYYQEQAYRNKPCKGDF